MTDLAEPINDAQKQDKVPVIRASAWEQRIYLAIALLVAFAYVFCTFRSYWVPAHSGVDQNGYLFGGKMLAEHLTMRYTPQIPGTHSFDPHQYVSRMWVGADFGTDQQSYYPKYPIGYPALIAIALWIGGDAHGLDLAYSINPIAIGLAILATYLLLRRLVQPFWAFCGMIVYLSSPMVMGLTTNPNSHATAACCAAWGVYLMLRWWSRGGIPRALLGGFLCGYAGTIRYSEGVLLLPVLTVVLLNWRNWKQGWAAMFGWLLPIGLLVSYNLVAMGHVTGYDGTNESSGFSWAYAADNWDTLLRQLNGIGLYAVFPLALVGLTALIRRRWQIGLVFAAWVVPSLLVYTAYYWAPDPLMQNGATLSYLRFFLTIVPGLIVCAFWLFDHVCKLIPQPLVQVCCGVLAIVAIAVQLQSSTEAAEFDTQNRATLKSTADHVFATVPAQAVLFMPVQPQMMLNHLQFLNDYVLYGAETFNKGFVDGLPNPNPDDPQPWDPGIRDSLYARLKTLTQAQLDDSARQIISNALHNGRRVFFLIDRRSGGAVSRVRQLIARGDAAPKIDLAGEGGAYLNRFAPPEKFDKELVEAWDGPVVHAPNANVRSPRRHVDIRLLNEAHWQLIEITEKPPAPPPPPPAKPTTKPTTKPAGK